MNNLYSISEESHSSMMADNQQHANVNFAPGFLPQNQRNRQVPLSEPHSNQNPSENTQLMRNDAYSDPTIRPHRANRLYGMLDIQQDFRSMNRSMGTINQSMQELKQQMREVNQTLIVISEKLEPQCKCQIM